LEVFIISGPVTHKFAQQNPVISRTIEVRRDQTLHDLRLTIFRAFHREDEHMYEFQLGKGLNDLEGKRYVSPMALEVPFDDLELADDKIHTTRGVCPMAGGMYAFVLELG
jgi:pRiA4b ORF-3-like protein